MRTAFASFKNLVQACEPSIEFMVDAGIIKIIDSSLKSNLKDRELIDDIEEVGLLVEKNLKILT